MTRTPRPRSPRPDAPWRRRSIVATGRSTALAAGIACAASATAAATPPVDGGDADRVIRDLQRALDAAVDRIDELESRLDGRDERSAARAADVRALVADALADADGRSALLQDGAVAGYDGKAFVASPDGEHRLSVWGFIQTRFSANARRSEPGIDRWQTGFSVQRARLYLDYRGRQVGSRVRGTFGPNGDISLDQAYVDFRLPQDLRLRVGQFGLPLFQDEWVAATGQLAVNGSVVNTVFGQGATQGVSLHVPRDRTRLWLSINDGTKAANTPALTNVDADFAATARFEYRLGEGDWARFDDYTSFPGSPFAALLGVSAHFETGTQVSAIPGDKFLYVTANAGFEGDGWNLHVLGVAAYNDFVDGGSGDYTTDLGFLVQGGFFVAEDVELFSRLDWVEGGDDRANDEPFRSLTAGFNWYIVPDSQRLKVTSNVIWFFDGTEGSIVSPTTSAGLLAAERGGQAALQVQLQLIF